MTTRLLLAALALVYAPLAAADEITVTDGWVRAAPPGASVMAGYLTLGNDGTEARTLVGASSEGFKAVEIHSTSMVDGQAQMRREKAVTIEPGASVRFEPGGRHLMLMKPASVPSTGDEIVVRLEFGDGTTLTTSLPVRRGDGGDVDHSHHH